jgi:IclR family transcriptional regulator, KDG regulon repressor
MPKKKTGEPRHVQADKSYIEVMGKIFAVLEYLVQRGGKQKGVAFVEVATAVPFARTTVHRILYSLEKLGYIEKDEIRAHYQLAAKFHDLTGPAIQFRRLQSLAKSVMQNLLLRFGETINLGVLEDGQVTYIDVLQSSSSLRIAATPGERNPVHCTALGKAMLAFQPESDVQAILQQYPLVKKTPRTITQKKHLLVHLASVRERAVALDLEENLTGVICVAAPIFDKNGRVVAGISLSGPSGRMEPKLTEVQEEIRNSAKTLSRMLSPMPLAENGVSPYAQSSAKQLTK